MTSVRRTHSPRVVLAVRIALFALAVAITPFVIRAQSPAPKPITLEDYPKFKRITGAVHLDRRQVDALHGHAERGRRRRCSSRRSTATRSTTCCGGRTPPSPTTGDGSATSSSRRRRRVGAGAARARGASTPAPAAGAAAGSEAAPTRRFELLDLSNGTKTTFPSVGSFAFSPDGEWLLIRPQGAQAAPAADAAAARGGRGGAGAAEAPAADRAPTC